MGTDTLITIVRRVGLCGRPLGWAPVLTDRVWSGPTVCAIVVVPVVVWSVIVIWLPHRFLLSIAFVHSSAIMSIMTCIWCKTPFEPKNKHKRSYCSRQCRTKFYNHELWTKIPESVNISTGTVGAIGELVASTDLLSRGFPVFRALSPSCPCDLVIIVENTVVRIEVRTGYEAKSGRLYFSGHNLRADVLAIVARHDRSVHYHPLSDTGKSLMSSFEPQGSTVE